MRPVSILAGSVLVVGALAAFGISWYRTAPSYKMPILVARARQAQAAREYPQSVALWTDVLRLSPKNKDALAAPGTSIHLQIAGSA